jgi:hypothetical protein
MTRWPRRYQEVAGLGNGNRELYHVATQYANAVYV